MHCGKELETISSHLPRGRCGLKSYIGTIPIDGSLSPSARKVWIEISDQIVTLLTEAMSPSARKVWIEISRG